jgi:lysophospholipase L1-like esterase
MSLTLKLALTPVLIAQALHTRRRLPRLPEAEGPRAGVVGDGAPLRVLITGDSSAAGVGVAHQDEALAGRLVTTLARETGAQVHWRLLARSGLTTAQTLAMLHEQAAGLQADVAVVVTGVNDIIDQVPARRAIAARTELADWLRSAAAVRHVVFVPLPPVHQLPGLPQPLRWIAGTDARRHNEALDAWTMTRGDVSRVQMDLPLKPALMAVDGFHPGEPLYRYCGTTIALHIAQRVWGCEPSRAA